MKTNRTKAIHLLLGLALTLGLTLCLTGPAMAQTTATYTDVSSWADLQEAINGSSTKTYLRLSEDITAMSTQEALTIRQRKDIVLDLNGKILSRGLSEAQTNGHVIGITDGGELFIEDSSNGNGKITGGNTSGNGGGVSVSNGGTFTMDGGSIERNSSTGYGGGVSVSGGGTFTMENGAIQNNNGRYGGGASVAGISSNFTMKEGATISDNNSSSEGGGVCVYGGHAQFIMYDGSIEGNSSSGDGGGVSVSNGGTFNMSGGTISENTSLNGSGVKVGIGGTFNMTAGSIQKNTASSQGGGVYLNGLDTQFKLEGGTVSGNQATLSGGGVYTTHGTITMSGGEIKENTSQDGGGVNVGSNGTLAMIGGLISGNTATYRGGGVYLYDSGTQMTMSGGTIQNNTAGSYGGGIYAGKSFTLQGTPTITDNTVNSNANNVYLNNFADTPNTINIGSNFTPSSKIGVTLVKSFKVFTSGASFADDAAAQAVFISDTPAYEVCAKSGQAALRAVHFNLWVGDDQEVTGDHLANDTRTWSFNPWTNTLTLDGYQYEGRGHEGSSSGGSYPIYGCIYYAGDKDFNLEIKGENSLTNTNTNTQSEDTRNSHGIYCNKKLTISGMGSLTTTSIGTTGAMGINCTETIEIKSGTVTAKGNQYGINGQEGVTISDGNVTAKGCSPNDSYGIYGTSGKLLTIGENVKSVIISGTGANSRAVYGLSVVNAVKGAGWSNAAGTEGQTEIAVNASGQSLNYKKVLFPVYDVTFKVKGGSWNNGDTDDITVMPNIEDEEQKLTPDQIPKVGDNPDKGYKAGNWDTVPIIDTVMTEDATYTYIYAEKSTQTIDAENVMATYGDTDKKVIATTTGDGTISYAVKGGSEDYIDVAADGKLTIKKVPADGKAYVTVTAAETDDYKQAAKDVTVTINKKEIKPTVSVNGWTYGETANTPTVTGNDGGGNVTYTYAAEGSSAFSGTVPTDAGKYTVKAVIDETENYLGGEATAAFTIAKAESAAADVKANNRTYDGTDKPLVTVTGEAVGGVMQYTIGTREKPTGEYTDGIPAGTDAGTYTVWFKVKGDANHNDSEGKSTEITIFPKNLTITADSATKAYDGKPLTKNSYTNTEIAQGDTIESVTVSGSQTYVGSSDNIPSGAVITRGKIDAAANYNIIYKNGTLTVTNREEKYEITVEANSATYTYDGQEHSVSGFKTLTFIEDGVSYTVSGLSAEATRTDVGETPVEVKGRAVVKDAAEKDLSAQFNVKTKDGILTITKHFAEVIKAPKAKDLTYNGQAQELVTAGEATGGTMEYAIGTDAATAPTEGWDTTIPTVKDAGTYYVWYKAKGDANHADSESGCVVVTILKKALSVTADAKSKAYGEADPELTYTQQGLVEGETLQGALIRQKGENVGIYDIQQGTLTAGDNYIMAYTPAILTITKRDADVKTPPTANDLTYNRQARELVNPGEPFGGTMEYALGTDDKTAPTEGWGTAVPTGTNAGAYYVWYRVTGDASHKDVPPKPITVTILPKTLSVTADAKSKTYGDADPELTYIQEGLVEGDTIQGDLIRVKGETVGTYEIQQGALTAGDNYIMAYFPALLTITKGDADVTTPPTAKDLTYNRQTQELVTPGEATGGTMEYALGADDKTAPTEGWGAAIPTGTPAGTYYVWYQAKGDADHEDSQPAVITVVIKQKALTVTADAKSKKYGEADPELTYTSEGLIEGDAFQGALTRQEGETVGTYEILQGTLTAGDNYTITYHSAMLTITRDPGQITSEIIIGDNLPNMTVSGFDDALTRQLCTPEDIKKMEDGENINVSLKVTRLNNPPANDKAQCEKAAAGIGPNTQIGMYMDISIFKQIGDDEPVKITDTGDNMIDFTVYIPEELREPPANTKRTFYIIEVHEGTAENVPVDRASDFVSFRLNHFSTFALAYQDTANVSPGNSGNKTNTAAKTGVAGNDNTRVALIIVGVALAIGATAFVVRRRKDNQ